MSSILILSAGRRVELLNSFISAARHLLPANYRVLAADSNPDYSAACLSADSFYSLPRINDPSYIDSLYSLCLSSDVKLVIPTIDTELEVLARERHNFCARGIHIVISDLSFVSSCRDKKNLPN